MAVAIFTVFLVGFILGGSTVYLVENHFRTKEMNKIYKLTESLINGNDLDDSDIGKETLYSKTANQLIRLQEMLEGRRKEAEKSQYEIQKLISEIAHQLRTPLANIKNYTELLQESLDETQEVLNTEYMKDLRTSEEQLCFLVESFIKTARLEQGIIQVHMQKENLVETILNALGQIQKKAEDAVLTGYEKPADQSETVKKKRAEYGEGYYKKYAAGNGTKYYRVRKSWTDAASQLGAFTSLENAKSACKAGYTVYDDNGKAVYTAVGQQTSAGVPFSVQVDILDLNIRTGAGTNYAKTGETTGKGVFTIVEVKAGQGASAGWGRLKSGAGWISLDYATRLA